MAQPPLPVLSEYWTRPEDRSAAVNALFDRSARQYDRICAVASFGAGKSYRRQALRRAGLHPGMAVLDVGTGTGQVAREAVRILGSGGRIVGIDPSAQMMGAGRRTLAIDMVQGVGEQLPFADGTFDFVLMGYALRHVADLDQAFREYRRVLRPAGRVLLLEITRPASRLGAGLVRVYMRDLVPLLAYVSTGSADARRLMRFYWDTIEHCVPPETVLQSLRRIGFNSVDRNVVGGLFSEYTAVK